MLLVTGILAADNNLWLMLVLMLAGAAVLALFFVMVRRKERAGQEPLLSTSLFRNRTSNLGLVTQNAQWLVLMGVSFVVSAYLQVVRGNNAIQTGIIFTAATAGLLLSSSPPNGSRNATPSGRWSWSVSLPRRSASLSF